MGENTKNVTVGMNSIYLLVIGLCFLSLFTPVNKINAFSILLNFSIIFYGFFGTILAFLFLIGIIIMYLFVFSDKIDLIKMNISTDERSKSKRNFDKYFSVFKFISIFILSAQLNYNYIAALSLILFIEEIFLQMIIKSVRTKIALLTLAEGSTDE